MGRVARVVLGLASLALAWGCVIGPPPLTPDAPVQFERSIVFYGHPLVVHLVRPCALDAAHPLLLYATGDGGWRGKDLDTFRHLARWGYPLAGFSAPDYLKHLGDESDTTTPARLAEDYGQLIAVTKDALGLPADTPTVLVGVSRGADLSVVAAGQRRLQPGLAGVLAVALTREEEYVRHRRFRFRRRPTPAEVQAQEMVMVQLYEYLPQLGSLPISVIQSTNDNYLPADQARVLFGPDSTYRQFHSIAARDHSFGGARDEMYAEMKSSLTWIVQRMPGAAAGRTGER